jgi:predicted ATPase/DNA-binding winged helix-turn-helix (wHTH) protein
MPSGDYRFGPFTMRRNTRQLFKGGDEIRIGSRALEVLLVLLERPGQTVSATELMRIVWPETTVLEANLTVQISALRRALSERRGAPTYISTIPGRGYALLADVQRGPDAERQLDEPDQPHFLPWSLGRLIGREDDIARIALRLASQRLITLTGPGGVGKTVAALAVAERVHTRFRDGVQIVDLSPVNKASMVADAWATAIAASVTGEDALGRVCEHLRPRQQLLVIDNCEHVIDDAVGVILAVLRSAPNVSILATSRESLRCAGEWVYRLDPLDTPRAGADVLASEISNAPAVELFVERAKFASPEFSLADDNASAVAAICCRLDGIPLALELAAAQIGLTTAQQVAKRIEHNTAALSGKKRGVHDRQQTLRATLDWSYTLLRPEEQHLLCALALFRGPFDLDDATAVCDPSCTGTRDAEELALTLTAKSLVTPDKVQSEPVLRLLDATREHAFEKLINTNAHEAVRRRHARRMCDIFEAAEREWSMAASARWRAAYAYRLEDVRQALDWAFGPSGDVDIGCQLTVSSAPLWVELSLLKEMRDRARTAFAAIEERGQDGLAMRLGTLLGMASYETGLTPEVGVVLSKALNIARSVGDADQEFSALLGLQLARGSNCEFGVCAAITELIAPVARRAGHPFPDQYAECNRAFMEWHCGDTATAAKRTDEVLKSADLRVRSRRLLPFENPLHPMLLANRARSEWVLGRPSTAKVAALEALHEARYAEHAPTYYAVMVHVGSVMPFWLGDLEWAKNTLEEIDNLVISHGESHWTIWQTTLRHALQAFVPAGQPDSSEYHELSHLTAWGRNMLVTVHPRLLSAPVVARIEEGIFDFATIEATRAMGLRALAQGDAARAQAMLRRALDLARERKALGWELRAATGLAKLLVEQQTAPDARAVLEPVLANFSDDQIGADLEHAKVLLERLG